MAKRGRSGLEPSTLAWAVGWDLLLGDIPAEVNPGTLAARAADAIENNAPRRSRLARGLYGGVSAVALPYIAWTGTKWFLMATARVHTALYREMATVLLKGATSIRTTAISIREIEEEATRTRTTSANGSGTENGARMIQEGSPPPPEETQTVSRALNRVAKSLRDDVVGPLFYFTLFGVPGAVAYRVIQAVGERWSGRGDDPLGEGARRMMVATSLAPAMLSGLLLAGAAQALDERGNAAWETSRRQAREEGSLDEGWAEGALAGGLGVRIEGDEEAPISLGERAPTVDDLPRARRLFWGATAGAIGASLLIVALRHAARRR